MFTQLGQMKVVPSSQMSAFALALAMVKGLNSGLRKLGNDISGQKRKIQLPSTWL